MSNDTIVIIPYKCTIKIMNNKSNVSVKFHKEFSYNTEHIHSYCVGKNFLLYEGNAIKLFSEEIATYLINNSITIKDISIETFQATSTNDNVKIIIDKGTDEEFDFSLKIYAYYSFKDSIQTPRLLFEILSSTVMLKLDDPNVAYKIVDDKENLIANLPIGTTTYTEPIVEGGYKRKALAYNEYFESDYSPLVELNFKETPTKESDDYIKFAPIYEKNNNINEIVEVDERLKAFKSGIGNGLDLKVYKPNDIDYSTRADLFANLYGVYYDTVSSLQKTTFNYRIEYKGEESYSEINGELEFILKATGNDFLKVRVYRYATKPEVIKAKVSASVSYYKNVSGTWTQKTKTIESDVYTLNLDTNSVVYNDGGSATLTLMGNKAMSPNKSIKNAITEKAKQDADIKASYDNNKEVVIYNYNLYDDYYFSYEDKYSPSKPRTFKNTAEGTIYVSSTTNSNNLINQNGSLYANGYANSQLFDVEKTFTITVPYSESDVPLLTKEDIEALIPTNVDDRSYVYDGDSSLINTRIEIIGIGSSTSIKKNTYNFNGSFNFEAESVSIDSNAVILGRSTNHYETAKIHSTFDNNESYKYFYSDQLLPLLTNKDGFEYRYKYQLNIIKASSNVYFRRDDVEYSLEGDKVLNWNDDNVSILTFYAKEEEKTRYITGMYPPLDEDPFTGAVNTIKDMNGKYIKKDMIVQLPVILLSSDLNNAKFTVILNDINPESSVITYKIHNADDTGYTSVSGDYVTFSSYSTVNESKKFKELAAVINLDTIVLSDDSTVVKNTTIKKPSTVNDEKYSNYELLLYSNSNDLNFSEYQTEIDFDSSEELTIFYKIKVLKDSSSKWSPIIHNGFYYLNQDEYYMYSESSIDGVYEDILNYLVKTVYYSLNVSLSSVTNLDTDIVYKLKTYDYEEASISNNIIVSDFIYPKPIIDTKYYKEYNKTSFLTNVIRFDKLIVDYNYIKWTVNENLNQIKVYARTYNNDTGSFSEWVEVLNNAKPTLSETMKIQFKIEYNVLNEYEQYMISETLSSYNDFVNDCDFNKSSQISITNGMLQQSYTDSIVNSIYHSVILDYGNESEYQIDKYYNILSYDSDTYIVIHAAASNNYNDLILNPNWIVMDGTNSVKGRYLRYRVEFNHNVVVVALYKNIKTKKSINKVQGIKDLELSAIGKDNRENVTNIVIDKSADITYDTKEKIVSNNVYDDIEYALFSYGYTADDIENITIQSKADDVTFSLLNKEYNLEDNKISNVLYDWKRIDSDIYNNWRFDDTSKSINHNYKSNSLSGFVTSRGYKNYSMEATVSSNTNSYNPIGLIAAYTTDSLMNEHILTLLVSPIFKMNELGDTISFSLYYNYNKENEQLIFSEVVPAGQGVTSWNDLSNGIKVKVTRDNDILTFYRSDNDEETFNDNYKTIVGLNDFPILSIFKNGSNFGLCNIRQSNSKYSNLKIAINDNMNYKVVASSDTIQVENKNSAYIEFVDNKSTVSPLPQQFAPITLVSEDGDIFRRVFFDEGLINEEHFNLNSKIFKLSYKDIDASSIEIYVDEVKLDLDFNVVNNFIFVDISPDVDRYISFKYKIINSFYVDYNIENDCIDIYINPKDNITKALIQYETNEFDNKRSINYLSLNPIHNVDYQGYIYITDEVYEPYEIYAHYNPNYVYANGVDNIIICLEVVDKYYNPVIGEEVNIDCLYGDIEVDSYITDTNGVVRFRYYSSTEACEDTITTSCFSNVNIKNIFKIKNLEV